MSEFILSGFSDEISPDFTIQLEEVKKLGIAYIEIRGVNGKSVVDYNLEEIKVIKQQLNKAKVRVSAIGSPIGKIHITEDFEPHFETFKHTINIAKILETNYIRLFSFFVDEGTANDYREEVMNRMSQLTSYAKDKDIILLHENEKDIYGDTPERCLDLVKTLNSKHFKLIFDPANFVQCGVETYPYAFEILKDYVNYYHIKDALMDSGEVVPSGFGHGHLPEIISELNKGIIKGFLSLEPHLGYFEGFSALEGEGEIPEFTEKSDIGKFNLAYKSLKKILDVL